MNSSPEARARRARDRWSWPLRRYTLGNEPSEDLRSTTTALERLGMMWELALQAWSLSDRPLPDYDRRSIPGRVVRVSR